MADREITGRRASRFSRAHREARHGGLLNHPEAPMGAMIDLDRPIWCLYNRQCLDWLALVEETEREDQYIGVTIRGGTKLGIPVLHIVSRDENVFDVRVKHDPWGLPSGTVDGISIDEWWRMFELPIRVRHAHSGQCEPTLRAV